MGSLRISPSLQNLRFCRSSVHIHITGLRISCRPTIRFKILQIQIIAPNHPSDRISPVIRTPYIVPFFANHNKITVYIRLLILQNIYKTTSGDRTHTGLFLTDANNFEQSRRNIYHTDIIIHFTSRLHQPVLPHHTHRDMIGIIVFLSFTTRKRHSVIRSDNDNRIFQFAGFFQYIENTSQMRIKMLHFQSIIQHIRAYRLIVRPITRHRVYPFRSFSNFQ